MMVVGFLALAIAGCAAMLGAGHKSLFTDISYAAYADVAQ
jgi:Flp pilus assembly pilin Flp